MRRRVKSRIAIDKLLIEGYTGDCYFPGGMYIYCGKTIEVEPQKGIKDRVYGLGFAWMNVWLVSADSITGGELL